VGLSRSGAFTDKNVGSGKTVTVTNTLGGADAANYLVGNSTASADITPATLTLRSVIAADKVYDGNTATQLSGSFNGVFGSDVVTLGGPGAFDSRNVGAGKTVSYTVGSGNLGGADAGNYVLASTSGTTTASITPATLSLSSVSAADKTYDGNTTATLAGTFAGVVSGDVVTLGGNGSFDSKHVGSGKSVSYTVGTSSLAGADAGNYVLATTSGAATANITAKPLTIGSVSAADKTYDGNTAAALAGTFTGVVSGDAVTLGGNGTFDSKNVGAGKSVSYTVGTGSLAGADAGNYQLATASGSTTASITAATLTLGTVTAASKTYDGNAAATLIGSFNGLVGGDVVTLTGNGAFDSKNVGTGKTVSYTVGSGNLGGADAGNYVLASTSGSTSASITPATLTVRGTAVANKVYDGTAVASVGPGALVGVVAGDSVSLSRSGAFADKNVGSGKTVTVTNILGGADAANYLVGSSTASADITPVTLSVNGTTASAKVYDGSTLATVSGAVLGGVFAGDNVTLAQNAVFADKNAGAGKAVTVFNTLRGVDAGNYSVASSLSASADITPKTLTLTGTRAASKVYDGTVSASISGSALVGVVVGDTVTLSQSARFADKNAGTGKLVTVTSSLGGGDAANYALATPSTTSADITPRPLVIASNTAASKAYDGTTAATVTETYDNVVAGDSVVENFSAAFLDKNVGLNKPVNFTRLGLSGADAGNYSLVAPGAGTATADIYPAGLTAVGVRALDKVYDGSTSVQLTVGGLVGLFAGDVVVVAANPTSAFSDKNVGTGKAVSYALDLYSSNYVLVNPRGSASASITPASLALAGAAASNKVYDGSTTAAVSARGTLVGVVAGDSVVIDRQSARFGDRNAGTGKAVTVASTLGGTDAANYTVTDATLSADITPATLSITGVQAASKVYDGGNAATLGGGVLSGVIGSDDVALVGLSGAFVDRHAGVGKAVAVSGQLGGSDAGNYIAQASTSADITPRPVTVSSLTAANKVYDGTVATTVSGGVVRGAVAGDDVSVGIRGAFADKRVGVAKPLVSVALAGADAADYRVTGTTASADITPAVLTVSGTTAADKVYDGTVSATVRGGTLTGAVAGDDLVLSQTGAFTDKNVAAWLAPKTVNVTSRVSGADAANYVLVGGNSSTTATIFLAMLTVSGTAAANKVYDGSTAVTLSGGRLGGILAGDDVTLVQSGAFSDKFVQSAKPVDYVNNVSGADAGNYALTTYAGTVRADITPAPLTVRGTLAQSKVYDGGSAASVGGGQLQGVIGADNVVVLDQRGVFSDKNVGTGKTVTVSSTIGGADAVNYAVTDAATRADITPATLTLGPAAASNKFYDGNALATVRPIAFWGLRSGDEVSVVLSGSFSDKNAGTGKSVSYTGSLAGADAGNYLLAGGSGSTSADIVRRQVTIGPITADDKVYDGGTSATLHAALNSAVAGDSVAVQASGAFADKNVGARKPVTYAIGSLMGSDAGNYQLFVDPGTVGITSASITPAPLTVSGTTAANKVYDGSTVATVQGGTLAGVIGSDRVALSGQAGSFADRNVGVGKPVSVTGTLSGVDAVNYTVLQAATSADITPATLTVSGTTASSKTYDGTAAAELHGGTLNGLVFPDNQVGLAQSGAFSDKNVGSGKLVRYTSSLWGPQAGNYVLAPAAGTTTADITPATLSVSGTVAASKAYDGSTSATVGGGLLSGVLGGDTVLLSQTGAFNDKNVGQGKPVVVVDRLSGADAGNYVLSGRTSARAAITPALLSVTGAGTAHSKVYDGSTAATGEGGTVDGLVAGDVVSVRWQGQFGDPHVGTGKSVFWSDLGLVGQDAGNYVLHVRRGTVWNATADITPAPLIVRLNDDLKALDDRPYAGGNGFRVGGLVGPDTPAVLRGVLVYGGSAQGASRAGRYSLSGSGLYADDYAVQWIAGTLTLVPPLRDVMPRFDTVRARVVEQASGGDQRKACAQGAEAALDSHDGSELLCVVDGGVSALGR
jgi:hypothetical protein